MENSESYTVFEDTQLLGRGSLPEVILKLKKRADKNHQKTYLVFSDQTGKSIDFNIQGSESEVVKRLEVFVPDKTKSESSSLGPGRPKLGVVSREVSLLPRQWEWLATQSGGASATLRRLVDEAKKKSAGLDEVKQAKERTYKFMSVIAGDFQGYEEALRLLYRGDKKAFMTQISEWPEDVRKHALELAKPIFQQ